MVLTWVVGNGIVAVNTPGTGGAVVIIVTIGRVENGTTDGVDKMAFESNPASIIQMQNRKFNTMPKISKA